MAFQALKDIAGFYRENLTLPVIGITGSVGKTSTKEFVASVLETKYNVLKTAGNFNNLDFKFSKWHCPIFVNTQILGLAILLSLCISPKSLMPISSTAASCSSLMERRKRKGRRGNEESYVKEYSKGLQWYII